ncbi:hypothetical protein GCM10007049_31310 [Echinicola pacifica]|uniref:DUF4194 domain-containing protein n=1 Tax=Echinicola pacifica TaxID=346377 RepID=A0A918Q8Q4_9BACT|nr:DUF4194 domain-containing protein [Echinicola pacifica]GGZ35791.1 hypothetical protein GCM10007049_31310 [Echinicola pacifica]
MENQSRNVAPYAKSAVKLLQGPVFEDQENIWNEVLQYQVEIAQYFEKIALEVIVDKRDGYAYLKQIELDESGSTIGLVRRIPLTYDLTLVCVLLREWLLEFELSDLETVNLYITAKEFRERMEMFFKEKTNDLKFIKELNRHLDQCVDMGFLKLVHKDATSPDEHKYEVKRILKARITTDELSKFKQQLEDELKSV